MNKLSDEEIKRYKRNIILKEIGKKGQLKLQNAKVLVIGAGGLGSSSIMYLAAAGIGTIGIIDFDKVKISNLQRQIIHFTRDLELLKTKSAKNKVKAINPNIKVEIYNTKFSKQTDYIVDQYDIILDCTDNFKSKFLINDICVTKSKPFIHAGILEFEGQIMTVIPGKTVCFRCVFQDIPSSKHKTKKGVLGVLPGMIGILQATEVLKYILGIGDLLMNKVLAYNALTLDFRKINIKTVKKCSVCTNVYH